MLMFHVEESAQHSDGCVQTLCFFLHLFWVWLLDRFWSQYGTNKAEEDEEILDYVISVILYIHLHDSIEVSIPVRHTGDQGSIPCREYCEP